MAITLSTEDRVTLAEIEGQVIALLRERLDEYKTLPEAFEAHFDVLPDRITIQIITKGRLTRQRTKTYNQKTPST